MQIEYKKPAIKYMAGLPKNEREHIRKAIEEGLTKNPPTGDIKPMQGRESGLYRLRIGRNRVIYSKEGDIITIFIVGARGDIYK